MQTSYIDRMSGVIRLSIVFSCILLCGDVARSQEPTDLASQPDWRAKWIWRTSSPWLAVNPRSRALEFPDIPPGEKKSPPLLSKDL